MVTQVTAARLMTIRAARLKDAGIRSDMEAGMAKLFASEVARDVTNDAVQVHGGYGYITEYRVERYLRESLIPRIAPISPHLILSFLAERVLGLPKSY